MITRYVDTHCHLNFKRFKKTIQDEIAAAQSNGVSVCIVPGTDIPTSMRAIEVANQNEGIFAAVGLHPHHVYEIQTETIDREMTTVLEKLTAFLTEPKVVAIGEVGLDRHPYEQTKYERYAVTDSFISYQEILLEKQIQLAVRHTKSLILHNREAKTDMVRLLSSHWSSELEYRSVFHCCEPDRDLLQFAQTHHLFIGVDGDVTYNGEKTDFIKTVPLEMLVLETDSPFLLPEPLRTLKQYPNSPKNIPLIAKKIAEIKQIDIETVMRITTENAIRLFNLPVG